ncbi:MAG: nucleotidyltransferase family protein, partial [Candidatus Anstonellales archaeon]
LCYHRIAGLAYETLRSIQVRELDFPVFFTLYMIHQAQSIRTELQKKYIKIISLVLCRANIDHAFLKGAVLSSIIYPLGARVSNDIDILVRKESIQNVEKILYRLKFLQGQYDYKKDVIEKFGQDTITWLIKNRGVMAPFVKITNKQTLKTIDIDINFSLDGRPGDYNEEAVNHFLKERILIPFNNNFSIYSLKKEHLFIHLCNHFYKDVASIDIIKKRKVLDLYKLVDIYIFIQKYFKEINPEIIYYDSIKFGFDRCVLFALNYIIKVFPDILAIKNVNVLRKKYNYTTDKLKMKNRNDLIKILFSYNTIKELKIFFKDINEK